MNDNPTKRIVIPGGGFAGLYAATELENTLAREPNVEITLVNRENVFLFTPVLHEVTASNLELMTIVNPLRKMLKPVNFFFGNVEFIDLPRKQVIVSHGFNRYQHSFPYDHLVIGLGSITNLYELPGLEERGLLMKSARRNAANLWLMNSSGWSDGPACGRRETTLRALMPLQAKPARPQVNMRSAWPIVEKTKDLFDCCGDWKTNGCCEHLRSQLLRLHRLVASAMHVLEQIAQIGEETARGSELELGPPVLEGYCGVSCGFRNHCVSNYA
jgi:hypothetical protein